MSPGIIAIVLVSAAPLFIIVVVLRVLWRIPRTALAIVVRILDRIVRA